MQQIIQLSIICPSLVHQLPHEFINQIKPCSQSNAFLNVATMCLSEQDVLSLGLSSLIFLFPEKNISLLNVELIFLKQLLRVAGVPVGPQEEIQEVVFVML